MSPKFSPDGTRIAYSTAAADGQTMDSWIVPVPGGQPRPLLANAEGLTWVPEPNGVGASPPVVLFSEMTGRGVQMSIVTSTESRAGQRTVYLPPEDGMAHRSYLSPDRKWVVVIEMDARSWLSCRLVPFDGSSAGTSVGPAPAQCTDAAWSPDGKWMYFSASTGSGVHTWRQRFPDGTPEQVTFGVTDEEGIHVAPDGRSFVTSIGTSQSTVWVHDSRGERQMTSEGFAFLPSISPDGNKLYYLVRAGGVRNWISGGLWVADLTSGQRQRLLPDFLMQHYSISADGQRVVFVAVDDTGRTPVWLASLDGRTAPRQLSTIDGSQAFFGAPGEVVFGSQDSAAPFIYRIDDDGGALRHMIETPMLIPFGCLAGWAMGRRADAQPVRRHDRVSGRRRLSHPDLSRLWAAPGRRADTCALELDSRWEIRLSEVRRFYVCDSVAAGRDAAAHSGLRPSIKGRGGCPAGSAAGFGTQRVSRPEPVDLCVHEGRHAAQHLSSARAVMVWPRRYVEC